MNHTHLAAGTALKCPAVPAARRSGATPSPFARAMTVLQTWLRRSRGRDDLAELDEHLLRDLGLSRSQAVFESGKSFLQR